MTAPTLEDRFGRRVSYLRVSVTDRCNFRCVYCMPEHGIEHVPRPEILSFSEIEDIVRVFAENGVDRVRITGGEPLVRADLPDLVRRIDAIEGIESIALTTNAFLLDRHAASLVDAGIRDVNISLDSLDPETFERMTRVGDLDRVVRGIDAACDAGFERVKLNAVIVRGQNDHELIDLVRFASERGALMRFIEFMPIGGETDWGNGACFTAREMRRSLEDVWELVPDPSRYGTGPARYWRLYGDEFEPAGHPVGIISAVTECFCADCNRVRLTPQGGLRACLADDREANLRDALRLAPTRDEGLARVRSLIGTALFGKKESHAFDIDGDAVTVKNMTSIGG